MRAQNSDHRHLTAVRMDVAEVFMMFAMEKMIDKAMKRERIMIDRFNPLEDLLPEQVKDWFRFFPETIYEICRLLSGVLQRQTKRSSSFPVLWQVLIAIKYFATGADYVTVGDTFNVSKPSVCHCIWSVAKALARLSNRVVKFPTQNTLLEYKRAFFALGGIPNITGAVDGCLIRIMRPTENTHEFICRKGWPAINIQVRKIYKFYLQLEKIHAQPLNIQC